MNPPGRDKIVRLILRFCRLLAAIYLFPTILFFCVFHPCVTWGVGKYVWRTWRNRLGEASPGSQYE